MHVETNIDTQVLGQCLLMLFQYPHTYYNVAQFCSSCLFIVKTTLELDQVSTRNYRYEQERKLGKFFLVRL